MRSLNDRMTANAPKSGSKRKPELPTKQGPSSWFDNMKRKKVDEGRAKTAKAKLTDAQANILTSASKSQATAAQSVLYRFNEGHTNAIKRPLTFKQLL